MSIATRDIRRRAIEAYQKGKSTQARIAQFYRVDIRTFQRWLARFSATGESAPQPRGHRLALFRGDRLAALDRLVQDRQDATLEELRIASKLSGSIMAVKRALDRLGYRYKKKRSMPANKTAKTSGCGGNNGLKNCPDWPRRAWCS
jgi:transposase